MYLADKGMTDKKCTVTSMLRPTWTILKETTNEISKWLSQKL